MSNQVHIQANKLRVLLPKTKFPLHTNPVTQEPAIQRLAKFHQLYKWQQETRKNSNKTFTLHDGPPYANGEPHMGHVLNKVLKDIIVRYKVMRGYKVNYRPGWDCHGLPIELKACHDDPSTQDLSPLKIRSKAAQFAKRTMAVQREAFKRWGCLGDWDNPYITMDKHYEANQIKVFHEMFKRGCIYRGYKPVYWSPSTMTALAEAELEYRDHISQAVYVLFPLANHTRLFDIGSPVHVAVWTTTPWTLLANKAVCFNPDHTYTLVKMANKKLVLVGKAAFFRLDSVFEGAEIIADVCGNDLQCLEYSVPLDSCGTLRPFIPGSHVSVSEGTGFVHTAPAHGLEDHHIGVKHGLDLECYVDDHGCYTAQVGRNFEGLSVLDVGNDKVLKLLANNDFLLHTHNYNHRYPYDWRSKKPVIIRSTEQWFASVKQIQDDALNAVKDVAMYPESSRNRFLPMLKSREDWCISRQRVWGVPLPIFYYKQTGEPLLNSDIVSHIEQLFRSKGSDCWWKLPVVDLLPPSLSSVASDIVKGGDTMDVWFDSGSSWCSVLADSDCVADMYLEGSDQHRGWFQSSLLTSVAAQGKAPYRSMVTHGFVLDEKGKKMSKSLGNVISPNDILHRKQFGADVIRLWVSSTNYTNMSGVNLGDEVLQQTKEALQSIRSKVRFMLGNLSRFDPQNDLLPYEELTYLDQYMLHLLSDYCNIVTESFESLNFSRVYYLCTGQLFPVDLSAFYFNIIKDTLYCEHIDSIKRRSVLTTFHHIVSVLVTTLAPLVPHLAEEVFQHYPLKHGSSVFQCAWPRPPVQWTTPHLASEFRTLRSVRDIVTKTLGLARSRELIKEPEQAVLHINTHSDTLSSLLTKHTKLSDKQFNLCDIFMVSGVTVSTNQLPAPPTADCSYVDSVNVGGAECKVQVTAMHSDRFKCPRCWKFVSNSENSLCSRCDSVLG